MCKMLKTRLGDTLLKVRLVIGKPRLEISGAVLKMLLEGWVKYVMISWKNRIVQRIESSDLRTDLTTKFIFMSLKR